MKALLAILLLIASAQPGKAAEPLPDTDLRGLVVAALTHYIRPGFAALAEASAILRDRTGALCEAPSPVALDGARAAFTDTVRAWSGVEYVRLGPMTEANRADRLYFWPDRKGITLRHVQRDLAAEDPGLLTAEGMAEASIAVQGLPALEFLLYGSGAEDLAAAPARYRCAFAAAVAANIAAISATAAAEWQDEDGFSALLLSPGAENPLYRNAEEAAVRITDIPGTGIHALRDQKLLPVIGSGPEDARPNLAPFRRSGLTNVALLTNLQGLKMLADLGGISAATRDRAPALQTAIDTVYSNSFAAMDSVEGLLGEAAADPERRSPVNYLALLTDRLRSLLQDQMPGELGMKVMFNAYDGD
ncbi:imelysin family protein [Marinibaculum pumilum]|uniref:Imelysin family protein n=1 Tax=Marinibaculum pumilum TaxID=1766165 RepID=A0ABV7KVL0_9PROT